MFEYSFSLSFSSSPPLTVRMKTTMSMSGSPLGVDVALTAIPVEWRGIWRGRTVNYFPSGYENGHSNPVSCFIRKEEHC